MNAKLKISDGDVRTLAQRYVAALSGGENVRQTYLCVLAARTIQAIGAPLRTNNAKAGELPDAERIAHLAALETTHATLYAIVNAVAEDSLADTPSKDRATAKNRRTNFARTALYAIRSYMKAGKDLTALAPARITKTALAIRAAPVQASPKRLRSRLERLSKAFMAAALELADADQTAAAAELDTLMGQLATQLASLGAPAATRNPERAAREHAPLKVGSQLFIPTRTTILRSRQNPS